MKKKDDLFEGKKKVGDFRFDSNTAIVFDDMVKRSVPFYTEIQRMIGEIAREFYIPGSNIYDLGCSTGTTLINVANSLDGPAKFVGCDNSRPMLKKAKTKVNNSIHPIPSIHHIEVVWQFLN